MCRSFWTIVAVLIAWSNASAAHAQTSGPECARLPTRATFQDGTGLNVIERGDAKIRYETTGRHRAVTTLTYGGLFPLTDTAGVTPTMEYIWNQELVKFFPLKVGDRIVADAIVKNLVRNVVLHQAIQMNVVGRESMRVAECDYPVLKIETRLDFGTVQIAGTAYYHEASMLTLRFQGTAQMTHRPPEPMDNPVVKLE
jgi:hypothetical protein